MDILDSFYFRNIAVDHGFLWNVEETRYRGVAIRSLSEGSRGVREGAR